LNGKSNLLLEGMKFMLEKALEFATKAHINQKRKIFKEPYIVHPIAVSNILKKAGFREEVIASGLLHDVVEDTKVTIEEIEENFGMDVANLVKSHTENKELSWQERKAATIETVRNGSIEVKALIVADKLDNLQSVVAGYNMYGDDIWSFFSTGYEENAWYYLGVAENLLHGLTPTDIPDYFHRYIEETQAFFSKKQSRD